MCNLDDIPQSMAIASSYQRRTQDSRDGSLRFATAMIAAGAIVR
jgi:hypothetical protein